MDTNKLKRFATEARNILMQGVRNRLQALGFDLLTGKSAEMPQAIEGGAVFMGDTVSTDFYRRWMSLHGSICARGIKQVAEEAAYTWFNRFVAIRIMQKQGFISPVLAYESEEVRVPVIVSEARQGRMPQMAADVREKLTALLDDDSKTNEQFALLIVAYCHENPIINKCFGNIADYTELLLPQNILAEGGFVSMLNDTAFISDDDFRSAELIGWLYQFYISDRKDEAFAKKGKYDATEIAPATQIFTPNWIVKYMVENTVGRIYIDNNPYCEVKDELKYLVGGAVSHRTTNGDASGCGETPHLLFSDLSELTVADLACGSGHILNECFDLLYKIYVEEGYSRSQAIKSILRKNLLGIDLDTRAKQLATFAMLMKACQKDTTFLDGRVMPRVYDMPHPIAEAIAAEGDRRTAEEYLRETLPHYLLGGNDEMVRELTDAILLMNHADTLGSIMKFDIAEQTRNAVMVRTEEYEQQLANGEIVPGAILLLMPYMRIILALTAHYAALCMNPPYMGSGRFDTVLSKYVKDNYEDGKSDLFSVFMLMGMERLAKNGKMAQINMQSCMFLSSFEKLRTKFLEHYNIDSMLHLGPRTFDELSGEVVQNTAFVVCKHLPTAQGGTYYRLVEGKNCADKEQLFLSHIHGNDDGNRIYYPNVAQKNFEKIPGGPIGYWVGELYQNIFTNYPQLRSVEDPCIGMMTWDNNRFLRIWHEVSFVKISFSTDSVSEAIESSFKWFPYIKGGNGRKWYGSYELIVNWQYGGKEIMESGMTSFRGKKNYFKSGITYPRIGSSFFCARFLPKGFIFDINGPSCFPKHDKGCLMAYLNSCVSNIILKIFCPTLTFQVGDIFKIPFKSVSDESADKVNNYTKNCITLSRQDWDTHETSWDFEQNPLVALAQRVGGAVSHRTTEGINIQTDSQGSGETPLLLKQAIGGAVSHRTTEGINSQTDLQLSGETPLLLKQAVGGAVSHRTTEGINSQTDSQGSGETPLLLKQAVGGAVSHRTTERINCQNKLQGSGETPLLLKFVNKREYIDITGNKLPHWNQRDCVQFVTFRLADSLPQAKLMEYRQMREEWLAAHPKPWDGITQEEYDQAIGGKIDKWLEAGYGSCLLQDERTRKIVEDAILHYDGERYVLHAYVIMPNHVHVLLTPGDGNVVQDIVGGWKKYTAHVINKLLNKEGAVWERESFDRMVRSSEDFEAKLNYIAENPQHLPSSSYTLNIGGAVSHRTTEDFGVDVGGAVSHCANEGINSSNESQGCGETPHLLMADLVAQYEAEWTDKFMQLHANEEELNRQFISIYGLEDELQPDVPLSEITILQQGEISIE